MLLPYIPNFLFPIILVRGWISRCKAIAAAYTGYTNTGVFKSQGVVEVMVGPSVKEASEGGFKGKTNFCIYKR